MTATQTEFAATDTGIPVASQELSLTPGPSPLGRLLARRRVRGGLAMLGPAFVASVAYVDPGNFATNIQGGAQYGYLLLWVVLAANLMAMVVQYLSAKLGIVTGRALPELVRDRLPRPATWAMWVQGEVVAMATDVAEFIGAALGLNLLFGVPMLPAGLMTGLITFAVLGLRARGRRRFEQAIVALLGFVTAGFLYEALRLGPSVHGSLHGLVPGLDGAGSLYLAVGILGATVMPHVIYLHSALTKDHMLSRGERDRHRLLRFQQLDVVMALGLAGLVNMAMLAVAARAFHTPALAGLDTRPGARRARPACRRRRGAGVRGCAAGLRRLLIQRRHLRRRGHHGRLRPAPGPPAGPPDDHHASRTGDPGRRGQPHQRAGTQPGRAVLRRPVRAGAARHSDQPPRRDGLSCQSAPHHHRWRYVRGSDHRPERAAAVPVLLVVSQVYGPCPSTGSSGQLPAELR